MLCKVWPGWIYILYRVEQANNKYQQIIPSYCTRMNTKVIFKDLAYATWSALLEFSLPDQAAALYTKLALQAADFAEPQHLLDFWLVTAEDRPI